MMRSQTSRVTSILTGGSISFLFSQRVRSLLTSRAIMKPAIKITMAPARLGPFS
jgi:hypothetical protein